MMSMMDDDASHMVPSEVPHSTVPQRDVLSAQPAPRDEHGLAPLMQRSTLPAGAPFFESASNLKVTGGHFSSISGHQTNLSLTINITQEEAEPEQPFEKSGGTNCAIQPVIVGHAQHKPEEDLDTQLETLKDTDKGKGDTSIQLPIRPPTPPIRISSEIYYRHLSVYKFGYPLWIPEPNNELPIGYQRRGIQIGDVGIITPFGSFDFLFNICLPSDNPINPNDLPDNFFPLDPPLNPEVDISTHLEFKPHSHLKSSSIKQSYTGEEGGDCTFESSASEGAIVTMPDGAYSQNLGNRGRFVKYLRDNAEHWYRYVNGVRGREARNGDVRLVIGTHKAIKWGMATFAHGDERQDLRLRFKPTGEDSRVGRTYGWEYAGTAEAKVGPHPQEIEELRMGEDSEAGSKYRNQCLFVRTINAVLHDDTWNQLTLELEQDFDLDNGQHSSITHNSQSQLSGQSDGLGGSVPNSQSHNTRKTYAGGGNFPNGVYMAESDRSHWAIHPSQAINEMLLTEYPQAKMAITEDWDWMSVLREEDFSLPSPRVFCARIRAECEMDYDPLDGVISIKPKPGVFLRNFRENPVNLRPSPSTPGAQYSGGMNHPEGIRLRLMTLLSLYDLLPDAICNPPHGAVPLTLEEAIGPDVVRRCLAIVRDGHPSIVVTRLAEVLVSSDAHSSEPPGLNNDSRNLIRVVNWVKKEKK